MEYIAKTTTVDKEVSDCVIVGLFKPKRLSDSAKKLDSIYHGNISKVCQRGTTDGSLGQVTTLHNSSRSKHGCIVVVGCGEPDDFTLSALQHVSAVAANEVIKSNARNVINCLIELPVKDADLLTKTQISTISTEGSIYRYNTTKPTTAKSKPRLRKMKFFTRQQDELIAIRQGKKYGKAIASGMNLAKDLGNLPGNICTPTYLAERAKTLAKDNQNLQVEVAEETQMKKLGMGALLSVSNGSAEDAKLVCLNIKAGKEMKILLCWSAKALLLILVAFH